MPSTLLFTSESVTEGHPDKVCDQISDTVLDACLRQDPGARVACEVAVAGNEIFVCGEITTTRLPDIESLARGVVRDIGYIDPSEGFDAVGCHITCAGLSRFWGGVKTEAATSVSG